MGSCPHCKAEIQDNWNYCTSCAKPLPKNTDKAKIFAEVLLIILLTIALPQITIPGLVLYYGIKYYKQRQIANANDPIKIAKKKRQEEINRRVKEQFAQAKERLANTSVRCPHCHSEQVAGGIARSAFSVKKAVVGGVLFGGIGAIAGLAGNNKANVFCMKCGHTWRP
ncbi:MAG: hypothetical protein H6Q67_2176 [Firmicutes bacterium]|nr:hypothetical protein [Bacillota bacterium]